MKDHSFYTCVRGFAFVVVLFAGLITIGAFGVPLVALSGMFSLHGALVRTAGSMLDPGYWGLEVEVARLNAAYYGVGPQQPLDEQDIKKFVTSFSTDLSQAEVQELARVIHEECMAYGFAPRFVLSVIAIESAFVTRSISSKGAMGLMQLRPFVAKALAAEVDLPWEGKDILYEPSFNVRLGMRYLFHLILRYRDVSLALTAYNMGPSRLDGLLRRSKEPPYRYVKKVIGLYRAL